MYAVLIWFSQSGCDTELLGENESISSVGKAGNFEFSVMGALNVWTLKIFAYAAT